MQILINVTQDDIYSGKAKNCEHCPIALAVRRKVKPNTEITVYGSYVTFKRENKIYRTDLPYLAQQFIMDIDSQLASGEYKRNHNIKPLQFVLTIPDIT